MVRAHELQKFSRCPGKLRAYGAWAGLYLISLHIQARPFPTAGLGCPSQGGCQDLTCPSGASQSPSPRGTEELGDKEKARWSHPAPPLHADEEMKAHGLGAWCQKWTESGVS